MEKVILVDEQDVEVGEMEKLEAHEKGVLHRAFSVFIFNGKGQMLLQQRAFHKYHSGGLWTNACCSHPAPGESVEAAAVRRLQFEMGMQASDLHIADKFLYKAVFENGLTEHELDYVLIGRAETDPVINPDEVHAFAWQSMTDLSKDVDSHPENYTYWFREVLKNHRNLLGRFFQ